MERIIQYLLTHPKSRPALRNREGYTLRKVKGIVAHWTANTAPSANALNNARYFNLGSRYASAHYVVDEKHIVKCMPETEVAYHCGDKPFGAYRPAGKAMMSGEPKTQRGISHTPNFYTIGFEMCVNDGSNWTATYLKSVSLAAELLVKHGLDLKDLYRHFDITGKGCPRPFLDEENWTDFKALVSLNVIELKKRGFQVAVVSVDELNVRAGAGATHEPLWKLFENERVIIFDTSNGWACIGTGQWVNAKYLNVI